MTVALGLAAPLKLPVRLSDAHRKELFDFAVTHLIAREDSASNFANYIAATAECRNPVLSLPSIASCAPGCMSNPVRTFRNLLNSTHWSEIAIVDELFDLAKQTEAQVVLIEYERVLFPHARWGVVSLQALGTGTTVPLDWRRFCADGDDHEDQLQRCVHELLDEMLARYLVRPQDLPTIVAVDNAFGEWPAFRHSVAERVGKYGMLVSGNYTLARLNTDVYRQRNPGGRLSDAFGDWPIDRPPRPMPLRRYNGRFTEYGVPFSQGYNRHFAIVSAGPQPAMQIQGRRVEMQVAAVGAMLSLIHHASITRSLRLHAFQHSSDRAFRRHALLLSMLPAFLTRQLATVVGADLFTRDESINA